MSGRTRLIIAVVLTLCLAGSPALRAQEARGTILGRVVDATEAALPGVTVEAVNIQTGVSVTAVTNEQGSYRIPLLNPGTYRVTFTLSGFNTVLQEDVLLRVADLLTVNASMTVGGVAETVTVKAEAVTLDTASASLGQVVEKRRIEELPTREGNPMELVVLAPGVANTTDLRFRKSGMTHSQSQFESDGTGEKRSDYAIDGVPNSSSFGGNQGVTVAYSPPAISVEEFRVQTSTYDASLGNTPGAVVNVVTKSGTNRLRGDAHTSTAVPRSTARACSTSGPVSRRRTTPTISTRWAPGALSGRTRRSISPRSRATTTACRGRRALSRCPPRRCATAISRPCSRSGRSTRSTTRRRSGPIPPLPAGSFAARSPAMSSRRTGSTRSPRGSSATGACPTFRARPTAATTSRCRTSSRSRRTTR